MGVRSAFAATLNGVLVRKAPILNEAEAEAGAGGHGVTRSLASNQGPILLSAAVDAGALWAGLQALCPSVFAWPVGACYRAAHLQSTDASGKSS